VAWSRRSRPHQRPVVEYSSPEAGEVTPATLDSTKRAIQHRQVQAGRGLTRRPAGGNDDVPGAATQQHAGREQSSAFLSRTAMTRRSHPRSPATVEHVVAHVAAKQRNVLPRRRAAAGTGATPASRPAATQPEQQRQDEAPWAAAKQRSSRVTSTAADPELTCTQEGWETRRAWRSAS